MQYYRTAQPAGLSAYSKYSATAWLFKFCAVVSDKITAIEKVVNIFYNYNKCDVKLN